VIKLVAQYGTLLEQYLQRAQENPGSVSYLSPSFRNEFIYLHATAVKSTILAAIRYIVKIQYITDRAYIIILCVSKAPGLCVRQRKHCSVTSRLVCMTLVVCDGGKSKK